MMVVVLAGILAKLKADTTLTGYLGGAYIYLAKARAPAQIPSVTVAEAGESSKKRPTYNQNKHRDNRASIQVNVWVSSNSSAFPSNGEDADTIANRIDETLLSSVPVTNTSEWQKDSEIPLFEEDNEMFHVSLRYSFKYGVKD